MDFLEDNPQPLPKIYDEFKEEKPTTIRGRLNENIGKCFKRIKKGVYLAVKGDARAIIIEGDAWEELKEIESSSIDTIITDSPYTCLNVYYHGTTRQRNRDGNIGFPTKDMDLPLMKEFNRVLKPGGHFFSFMPAFAESTLENNEVAISNALQSGFTFRKLWVWDRRYFAMGYCGRNQHELIAFYTKGEKRKPCDLSIADVLTHTRIAASKRIHDAEKPVELIKDLMKFSNVPGDVVLDPFGGSLTTAQAGLELGVNTISIEIDGDMIRKSVEARGLNVEVL